MTNRNKQCCHSVVDPNLSLADAKEILSVAIVAAENIEVLLGAINEEMDRCGICRRPIIHMLEVANRLVAAQRDMLTSKRGGYR